jgi:hypothetical protein
MSPITNPPVPPLAYRVNDFCRVLGISRATFYLLVKRHEIRTICIAGRRLVPASEGERLISEKFG